MTEESPLPAAQQLFADAVPFATGNRETCPLSNALGRTLATDFTAPEDAPSYHRAIVEGFVVNTAETAGASEDTPARFTVAGAVHPGDEHCPEIVPGQALSIATGSILPDGPISCVRMWEAKRDGDSILVSRPFPPRFFVEDKGCDHPQGSTVLATGTRLSALDIGTIASFGVDQVALTAVPKVAIFSSGDEVIPFTDPMRPGAIRDSNQPMLAAAVTEAGAQPVCHGIAKDDFDAFVASAKNALADADMLLISGGTAVGGRDFISDLVRELGELLVDGVPMRSGRPLIMGVADGKPIVCVAGHPPEALRGFALFGVPALDRILGHAAALPEDAPQGPPPA